jgi:hypothetical protein
MVYTALGTLADQGRPLVNMQTQLLLLFSTTKTTMHLTQYYDGPHSASMALYGFGFNAHCMITRSDEETRPRAIIVYPRRIMEGEIVKVLWASWCDVFGKCALLNVRILSCAWENQIANLYFALQMCALHHIHGLTSCSGVQRRTHARKLNVLRNRHYE